VKRLIAIILIVLLSNVLIYWITSNEPEVEEEVPEEVSPLEEVEEPEPQPQRNLLLPIEALEAARQPRPLDPDEIYEANTRLWQEAARTALPNLVLIEAIRGTEDGEVSLPENPSEAPSWRALSVVNRGCGIVLDNGTGILTPFDLVSGADELRVRAMDGDWMTARPVAADLVTRLATLELEEPLESNIQWGLAVEADVAEPVLAVYLDERGSPLCLPATVTGLGYEESPLFPWTVKSFLSLDLDDTHMMPGALVVNKDGQALGMINSMGRVVMTEQVLFVADSLIRHNEVRRAWLGIRVQPMNQELAPFFSHPGSGGFLISYVAEGSPAEEAGLQVGDVITRIQGQSLRRLGLFRAAVSEVAPGSVLNLTYLREGEAFDIQVRLDLLSQIPNATVVWESADAEDVPESAFLDLLELSESEAGLVIQSVFNRNAVFSEEVFPGMLLESVNRRPVATLDQLTEMEAELAGAEQILLEVRDSFSHHFALVRRLGMEPEPTLPVISVLPADTPEEEPGSEPEPGPPADE